MGERLGPQNPFVGPFVFDIRCTKSVVKMHCILMTSNEPERDIFARNRTLLARGTCTHFEERP